MAYIHLFAILNMLPVISARQNYSMYVWTTGFDNSIHGCDVNKFEVEDKSCFSHSWDTREKRKWLWNTCNLPGREISDIYLSDLHHNLRDAYNKKDCSLSSIQWVRETMVEGHSQVANLKIYALYAVSDLAVSEKDLVKYVVYYNDMCAASLAERIDGVATNNEAYTNVKCGDMGTRLKYLDDLHQIVIEAGKQRHGKLLTHYSVSWNWGQCGGKTSVMTWNHKTSDVINHMIDIFDSIDIQVSYIRFPQISDRVKLAGYEYAKGLNKNVYVTVYTNKGSPCTTTFFPSPSCDAYTHTEANMFAIFDQFAAHGIPEARPCIHYFRGSYSSGGSPAWPKHNQATEKLTSWGNISLKTKMLNTVKEFLSGGGFLNFLKTLF